MANFYTVEKEINGVKYTAQFSGLNTSFRLEDETYIDGTGLRSLEKTAAFLFEYGIVDPKGLTLDSFGAESIGETFEKTINGKVYKAQFKGLSTAIRAVDSTYDDETGVTSTKKFVDFILKNIIVSPENLTVEDFTSRKELDEVVAFGRKVMQSKEHLDIMNEVTDFARATINGNFRPEKDEG